MKKYFQSSFCLLVAACVFVPASASAYTYATEVLWSGTPLAGKDANRYVPDNALGAPDGDFLALTFNEFAVFNFGVDFYQAAIIYERTDGSGSPTVGGIHKESAAVYGSFDADWNVGSTAQTVWGSGTWDFLADVDNSVAPNTFSFGNTYKYLAIFDTTLNNYQISDSSALNYTTSFDGFDISAVGVNPIPEPATMLLFGAGLAGLAGVARRRKEA